MKRTKENKNVKNPYASNQGGQIRAPFKSADTQPKGQKIVATDDLRSKK